MDDKRKKNETPEERAARKAAKAKRKAEKEMLKALEEGGPPAITSTRRNASEDEDAIVTPPAEKTDSRAAGKKRSREADEEEAAPVSRSKHGVAASAPAPAGDASSTAAYLAKHNMRVTGPPGFVCPSPMETFVSSPFAPKLLALFTASGYKEPTLTQAMAWPIALTGANIVSVAKTGSGKTLGFLLPVMHQLASSGTPAVRDGFGTGPARPTVLVLAPTRELACQTELEAGKFGAGLGLRAACVYGGAPKGLQIRALRGGVDVVIGTPGRLQDLMDMGCLSLANVKHLVLDEADRMLDMGFEEPIRAIISVTPPRRQTLLFTATWPKAVQRLADEFCPSPVHMTVGDEKLSANQAILQNVEIVTGGDAAKLARLTAIFMSLFMEPSATPGSLPTVVKAGHGKAIVFVKFKAACDRVAQELWNGGFAVNTLHGDMEQRERTRVIDEFKAGKLRVLVATDVAARGLDVKDVTDVFNYDFPFGRNGVEDYVHRIGRTARAGATGTAHTFFDPAADGKNAAGLVSIMRGAKQVVPEALTAIAARMGRSSAGGRPGGGRGGYHAGGGRGGRRW